MFPLKVKKLGGYKFSDKTWYSLSGHTGTDYVANYDTYYLPYSGVVKTGFGVQGGNWLEVTRPNGDVLTARHLSKFLVKPGVYQEGIPVAITGNTGLYTTNPHLHQEVRIKGYLVDPEKYGWDLKIEYPIQLQTTVLMNNQPFWNSLLKHLANLQNWFWVNSQGKIELIVDYKNTNLSNWPTKFYGDSRVEEPEQKWFNQNVVPLAKADILVFCTPKNQAGEVFDHPELMELGYCHKYSPQDPDSIYKPIRAIIHLDENDDYQPYYPELGAFAKYMAHEIFHGLYSVCANDKVVPGGDYTHNHFYGENGYPIRPEDCFNDIDYLKLIEYKNA